MSTDHRVVFLHRGLVNDMFVVKTHPLHKIADEKFTLAVVAARHKDKLVFVRRRSFTTWEMPGGHREEDESILDTAKRELYEETGASMYRIVPVCAYTVDEDGYDKLYGVLFVADIFKFGNLPESEIGEVRMFDTVPTDLTFPKIQAKLSIISLPHELCGGMGKDISIRRAQHIDIADLCELYRPTFVSTGDEDTDEIIKIEQDFRLRTTEHLLRTTIEKPNRHIFIAYDGIRPVGSCEIRLLSKTHDDNFDGAEIEKLTIAETHRRSGIGRHLTDCAVEYLKGIGCTYTVVWIPSADEQLCKMTEAQGFAFDGTREMTDTGSKLRFRKSLVD